MSRAPVDDRWIGQTLAGAYLIEERLGKGGMGAVYRAKHVRTGGLRAVKILHPEAAADPEIYRRFEDEAKITSALRHPHIVQVTDFDNAGDMPFIAMEYLDGVTLDGRVRKQGPLPFLEGMELLRQVGSALQAAHEAGVVHRDIKPQNILLCRYQLAGKETLMAKVLDFGISHIRRSVSMMTRDSTILGTPQYMAPEMARGRNSELDGRSDQFSLAVVLYYAFTGHKPFDSDDLIAVLHQVIYEQPEPLGKLAPQLPAHAVAAIERAMAKSKEDRFASMIDFVHAVESAPPAGVATAAAGVAPGPIVPTPASAPAPAPADNTISKLEILIEHEVSVAAADLPRTVGKHRWRWPVALGGLVLLGGAGLLSFALLRPRVRPPAVTPLAQTPKAPSVPASPVPVAAPQPEPTTPGVAAAKNPGPLRHTPSGRHGGTTAEGRAVPLPKAPPAEPPAYAADLRPTASEKSPLSGPPPPPKLVNPAAIEAAPPPPLPALPADPKVAPAEAPPPRPAAVVSSPPPRPTAVVSAPPPRPTTVVSSPAVQPEEVKAACEQDATQKARALYVRLEPRQRDFVNFYCAKLGINVATRPGTPSLSDPTPTDQELAQIVSKARDVLESDPQQASKLLGPVLEKSGGSGSAWLVYGMAACKQRNKYEAFAAYKQLDVSKRQKLVDYCQAAGFPLLSL